MPGYFGPAAARRAQMDIRESQNRAREFTREKLCQELDKDRHLHKMLMKDECLEKGRRNRHYQALADEQMMLDRIQEHAKEVELKRIAKLEHESVQAQLESERIERIRQERIRQSIRESSTELRDLEQKLQSAYMNAERAKQLEMKKYVHVQEQIKDQEYADQMTNQLKLAQEKDLKNEAEALIRSKEHMALLQNQLKEKEEQKRADMELFMLEKANVDKLIQQIHAEDAQDQQRRLAQQRMTRAFIDEYLQDRKAWIEAENAQVVKENECIEQYLKDQERRSMQLKEQKKAADESRASVYNTLAQNIGQLDRERQEIEDLRIELAEAENYEREQEQYRLQLQKRIKQRLDMIDAYKKQIEEKRQRRCQEIEDEQVFKTRMLNQLAENARLDQLTRESKRMKQIEHKRAVDAMVNERRALLEAEQIAEQQARQKERDLDAFRERVIEHERQRLLREHASKLLGYLPKGVFKDEKDLDLFDAEFRARFNRP